MALVRLILMHPDDAPRRAKRAEKRRIWPYFGVWDLYDRGCIKIGQMHPFDAPFKILVPSQVWIRIVVLELARSHLEAHYSLILTAASVAALGWFLTLVLFVAVAIALALSITLPSRPKTDI